MSEFKGTPGPWFVSECWDVESKVTGNMVAAVAGFEQSDEDRANANLIAAAPELLEALHDILSGWKYIRQAHGDLYGVGWDRAEQKATEAIKKALDQ